MKRIENKALNEKGVAELFPLIYDAGNALVRLASYELRKYNLSFAQGRILYILVRQNRAMMQNEL
jgi:hypothetical protein